jgi:protein involved in polysaccharide export with SLBB domain
VASAFGRKLEAGRALAFAASLAIGWTALVHGQARPDTPRPVETQPAAGSSVLRDGLYVLQRGDEISIRVFRLAELDDTVRIRPDGKISVPLLENIDAAGATTKELADALTKRYAELFKEPQVSVIVRSFANLKVYVGGEVGQPGAIPIVGDLTLVGAVFHAGGFKTSARLDSVVLVRNDGQDRPLIQTLNVKEIIGKGKADIALRPFDIVFVPESRIRKVNRFVDEYIRQLIPITATAGFSYLMGGTAIIGVQ